MATQRIEWAMGKVDAAGAWIHDPVAFSGVPVKTGVGVYELTLENAMGVLECVPTVTCWYAPPALAPLVSGSAGLKADGKTLVVNTFLTALGVPVPVDAAFCVVVDRFMPS